MSDAPRVIHNPVSGERLVIRTSAAETNGRLLAFDVFLPPGAHVPAGHVHPHQEERFTVIRGHVLFKIAGRSVLAHPGDVVGVQRGTPHWFGNAGAQEAHVAVEVRPALRMQELLETSAALSHTGRLPNLPELAALLLDFQRELSVPRVPRALANAILRPLAFLSRGRAT
jgi:quercetin dioxygenase-like cupin family protein